MQYKLIINLKSDLCASSGTGLGSLIDNDVCYDEYGLPYIPAKRIKGLLKEAAVEYCDWDENATKYLDEIFGIEGNNNPGSIKLSNAYLSSYEEIIDSLKYVPTKYKKYVDKQKFINLFTNVRYQTAIDDETGTSKDNSLRSTRVVNKDNQFISRIELDNQEEKEFISKVSKLVTHMGMNRTRGFGEVVLEIQDLNNASDKKHLSITLDDEDDIEIKLLFKAESDLMIAGQESEISKKYIPGSNILGNIARRYIEDKKIDVFKEMPKEYIDLFLNGKVKYQNCYISNKNALEFLPVPFSYTKVKNTTDQFYNKIKEISELDDKNVQLSSLGDKFVTIDENNYLIDVKMAFDYHHQRAKNKRLGKALSREDGGTLYQYLNIENGQYFLGKITGKAKYLKLLEKYIKVDDIYRVGKSKTAEYGNLKLIDVSVSLSSKQEKIYHDFAVLLTSDTIILDDNGNVTINKNAFVDKMKKLLGSDIVLDRSFINYEKVAGYNIIWNLPKEQVEAFKAGSIFSFKSERGVSLKDQYIIGQRTSEGYGNIRIIDISKYENNRKLNLNKYEEVHSSKDISELNKNFKDILVNAIKYSISDDILYDVVKNNSKTKLNNSTIGRLLLMVKESNDLNDFINNISEIKDIKKNRVVKNLFTNVTSKVDDLPTIKDLKNLTSIDEETMNKYYLEYIKQILIQKKIEGAK